MHRASGYRGLHEWLSGTRVLRLRPSPGPAAAPRLPPARDLRPPRPPRPTYGEQARRAAAPPPPPRQAAPDPAHTPQLRRRLVLNLTRSRGLPERVGQFEID